ncbi:ATP-dependent helicase [Metalysinibacillus jejuensis]|uniref:ATP-dependent helicase n=1 Tax=Metalysinibacillus jejuensis TaxID=914327 RepID=UPI0031F3BBDE
MITLNEQQRLACEHFGEPLLLLAAPGTGKTTTTIAKIGYLIEHKGFMPREILAVTFSKAAAQEMQARFLRMFPHLPQSVQFSTIHALAYRIFRAGIDGPFELIDDKAKWLARTYKEVTGDFATEDIKESLSAYHTLVKNLCITPQQLTQQLRDVEVIKHAERVYEAYETHKKSGDVRFIDYEDMLSEALTMLEQNSELRAHFQSQYRFILMDEAQDTSEVQHRIVQLLAAPHGNVYLVADDDQTIYSFRGSDIQNLFQFSEKYPGGVVQKMTHNYRSTQTIVQAANAFIMHVSQRFAKQMVTDAPKGEPIAIKVHTTHARQLEAVVDVITKAASYQDVAVLYRNNASSIAIAHLLAERGIPFYVKDVYTRFFQHFIMQDLRNYLRLAYVDKVRHMHVLEAIGTRFNGYLRKKDYDNLRNCDEEMNLWQALRTLPQMKPYQITFFEKCERIFPSLQTKTPSVAIDIVLHELGYERQLHKYIEFMGLNEEAALRILSTIQLIAKSATSLVDFYATLDALAATIAASKEAKDSDAVTLSTFHSAKGLEFDTVVLIDLQEGQVPTLQEAKAFDKGERTALDEAYRLFYVAMTRAKQKLYLYAYGHQPSRFLQQLKPVQKKTNMTPEKMYIRHNKATLFIEGATIVHENLGKGTIVAVKGDQMTVDFETGKKALSIAFCVDNYLVKDVT